MRSVYDIFSQFARHTLVLREIHPLTTRLKQYQQIPSLQDKEVMGEIHKMRGRHLLAASYHLERVVTAIGSNDYPMMVMIMHNTGWSRPCIFPR